MTSTYVFVNLAVGIRRVDFQRVCNRKFGTFGVKTTYKNQFVARGCNPIQSIDCDEMYSPVAKGTTIKFKKAVAAQSKLIVHALDVSKAYSSGQIDKNIFSHRLKAFIEGNRQIASTQWMDAY